MTTIGVAPAKATGRAIVGPFSTSAGFQYWYLACLPDCIVAVPQGIWTGMMLALSNSVPPIFGLLGALLAHFGSRQGQRFRIEIEAKLQNTPDSQLRAKPNTVHQIVELRSIAFKGGKFANSPAGSLLTPDIILETKSGTKRKYGVQGPDFQKACEQMRQMYPTYCKSI